MCDLDNHTNMMHKNFEEKDQTCYNCNFCEIGFESKKDLMYHQKKLHPEKVNKCWHFLSRFCDLGDKRCWFIHSNSNDQQKPKDFQCKLCEKVFSNVADYLKHQKNKS